MKLLNLLLAYRNAKKMNFTNREELEQHQAKRLAAFLDWAVANSPYFSQCARPGASGRGAAPALEEFPMMDKSTMMENFDQMNTAGLALEDIFAMAQAAENTRDFQGTLNGYTVGLSSGTSSMRGAFVVSDKEKNAWAAAMLAKMLPAGLFAGERVALFLRADSKLYQTVRSPWLSFRFFDLLGDFEENTAALAAYAPTIIVAPAQVLRQLALKTRAGLALAPKKVISVAEVLEDQDRGVIRRAFGDVHQVYQATEGFLGATCEQGTLHLNEEYLYIEKQWLDEEQRHFMPIITDFSRTTQPIIRYRLNDVLVAKRGACPCGRVTMAIERVEGRCDDTLLLPGKNGRLTPAFADALHRVFARVLPRDADYRLTQTGDRTLMLHAAVEEAALPLVQQALDAALAKMGIATQRLHWWGSPEVPPFDPAVKRRRITREYEPQA